MMMAADGWYIYYGRDDEVVPPGVTRVRIDESLTIIPAWAFRGNIDIEEVECHDGIETVEEFAFYQCPSLRRVRMPGVKVVEEHAFSDCEALRYVECDKLERIGLEAFFDCTSLRSVNMLSVKIVEPSAFANCEALTNVVFSDKLERLEQRAFKSCSLERITIPLKDGIIAYDNIFRGCKKLKHVHLVEEAALHETIAALQLEEWKNDMKDEIIAINQRLPTARAGNWRDAGEKAQAVQLWISSVLGKIVQYKAEHRRYLNEAATTLQTYLPNDILLENVLPFVELPSYTFQGEDTVRKGRTEGVKI